jgi:hypothetical protein
MNFYKNLADEPQEPRDLLRLWLPDFLKRNEAARAKLGVLVPPWLVLQRQLKWGQYLPLWEEKALNILRKLNPADAVDLFGVVGLSYHADSGGPEWWLMLLRDRVLDSALQFMKDYLDNPLKGKKPLEERFPPEDYEAKLSPAREVLEQKDLDAAALIWP